MKTHLTHPHKAPMSSELPIQIYLKHMKSALDSARLAMNLIKKDEGNFKVVFSKRFDGALDDMANGVGLLCRLFEKEDFTEAVKLFKMPSVTLDIEDDGKREVHTKVNFKEEDK